MKNTIWNKKIPTLLGLLIITAAIGITTLLVGQNTFFTGQASPTSNPIDLRITNVSDSSFTVSYSTASYILGSVNFGKDQKLGLTITDDKDNNKLIEHKIHSFTINNLSPSTKYFFSIISGQDTFLNNNIPYEIITAPKPNAKGNSGFIVGKVVTTDGLNPKEGIIYTQANGAQALSSIIKPDGTYTVSLEGIRKDNLSSFFKFTSGSVIKMLVLSDLGSSNAIISARDVNYVPTIVISKNYDFTQGNNEVASQSATVADFPTVTTNNYQDNFQITSPAKNQIFTSQNPIFKGKGIPNGTITIAIQSAQEIQGQITVDANGNWTFTPTTSLAPGQHTITITAKDSSGILRTITQVFTVQTAQAASPTPTPSATPVSSPTASPSSTPTATTSATPSASSFPTLSPNPTPIVISTPSPTPIVLATPVPTLPPTGTSELSTGIMGISLAVIGGFFFLLSHLLL